MYQTIKVLIRVLLLGLVFIMALSLSANPGFALDTESRNDMSSHQLDMALNHALGMTLEGYNLVMLGSMDITTGVDELSVEHGTMMKKNGTAMWNQIMSGSAMQSFHHSGKKPLKDPGMAYTHELGEKQLVIFSLLDEMSSLEKGPGMEMHHQHVMLNQALKMALMGANSIIMGEMGMAKDVDEIAVEHGRMMLKNARALFNDIMSGMTMMNMHKRGMTPESNALMKYTHMLAEAELQVLTILDEMPGVKK
jgi:polyhydroxyalkanoate synthesis regulator phasin